MNNLTLVQNLSSVHSFRLFMRRHLLVDGTPAYEMYSRVPVGGYALIKLATVPFDGLVVKIAAARLLMPLLLNAAAVLVSGGLPADGQSVDYPDRDASGLLRTLPPVLQRYDQH